MASGQTQRSDSGSAQGPDATSGQDSPANRLTRARRGGVLAVMCVGMFLVQLDVTVVNVALPDIRAGLGTGLAGQQWVVDAYAVVLASLLLVGGTVGDRYGHKRVVLTGMGLFGAASLACGVAPNVATLVAGRAVQGLGAALLLLPGTLAVITRTYPERAEQARAVGVWAGVSALALPAGPLLGGALVSGLGWQAVFLINLPVIVVAVPAMMRLVTESRDPSPRPLDLPGGALAAVTLGAAVSTGRVLRTSTEAGTVQACSDQSTAATASHAGLGVEDDPDPVAVLDGAQVVHAVQIGAGGRESPRRGAGGQQELGVADPAAVGQGHLVGGRCRLRWRTSRGAG